MVTEAAVPTTIDMRAGQRASDCAHSRPLWATRRAEVRHDGDRQPRPRGPRTRAVAAAVPAELRSRPSRRATGRGRPRHRTRSRRGGGRRGAGGGHGAVPPDQRDVPPHRRRGAPRLPADRWRHRGEHVVPGAQRRRPRPQLGRLPQRRRRRGGGPLDRLRTRPAGRAARSRSRPLRPPAHPAARAHAEGSRRRGGREPRLAARRDRLGGRRPVGVDVDRRSRGWRGGSGRRSRRSRSAT